MATRKKPVAPQAAFSFPTLTNPAEPEPPRLADAVIPTQIEVREQIEKSAAVIANAPITPTSLPVVVDEERKLRIVPPPEQTPDEDVLVEAVSSGRFLVSTLRARGTTVAAVYYSRKQLEMLLARIPAALEMGR